MKLTKALLLFLIFQNLAGICFGQQNPVYNHYFINPYLYNPSYLASSGYTELFFNYKQTWAAFDGAPRTLTFNAQIPLNYKVSVGAFLYNDKAGIYTTNTGYFSFAYQVHFGRDFSRVNRLGFGLSAGYTSSKLDLTKVSNPDDPAYNVTSVGGIQGQFGINYQFQNFRLGFALPRLMKSRVVTNTDLNSFTPLESTIATASYNFQLGPRVSLEPYLLYRTEKNIPSQFEVMGVLRVDNIGWIGGAYRQEYGASAFLGLNLKERIKVGYAYEFAPNQVNGLSGIGGGSHEVQLIIRLSKKKKERPAPIEKVVGDMVEEPDTIAVDSAAIVTPEEKKVEPARQEEQKTEPIKTEPVKVEPVKTEPVQPQEETTQPETRTETVTENPDEKKPEIKQVTKTLDGEALPPGHYVVVGAFRSVQNAKSFTRTLKTAGYPASVAFNPDKGYYIVHMGVTPSVEEAQRLRDVYRQKSRYSFKDTWILTIE